MHRKLFTQICAVLFMVASGCGGNSSSTSGGACNAAVTCGGILDGTWQLDTTCVEGNLAAAMESSAGLPSACSNVFQSATPSITGTVTFANGSETDNMTETLDATILYTSACVGAVAGTTVTLNASVCSLLGPELVSQGDFSSATCTFASGGCSCSVASTSQADTTPQAYTISGHTIVYADGSDPMDYCVSGTTLTTSGSVTGLPGVTFVSTAHKL